MLGVYAAGADSRLACAGITVQPAAELKVDDTLWVVATCASPGDVTALYERVSVDRVVHAVEPASVRPSATPFATAPAFDGLAYARESRAAGALRAAEAAYRALLRDPGFADAMTARCELALVHEQLGRFREAEAGLRWTVRHWPEGRATVLYNLGSFYERQRRWALAERAFVRALTLTPPHDAARRGGCHFHLGEIALALQDEAAAREHFTQALAAVPTHGKARARLDALSAGVRTLAAAGRLKRRSGDERLDEIEQIAEQQHVAAPEQRDHEAAPGPRGRSGPAARQPERRT